MAYEYSIVRGVEFSDTDMAGIMHFSNFFRFMEAAEHGFFRSLGLSIHPTGPDAVATVRAVANGEMDDLCLATVQSVEESIVNALIAAQTMTGLEGHRAVAIDHKELVRVMKQYGR